jgi:transcriptional regulator with XRE-family HTH domain
MSPLSHYEPRPNGIERSLARTALAIGIRIRDERVRRGWSLRRLATAAGLSVGAVHGAETGRPCGLETYLRIADALGLHLELLLADPRRRVATSLRSADAVHAAMGDLQAGRLNGHGFPVGIDEPYQHYQFAGRADVVAWDVDARALLHLENRTRFPDLQEAAGAWNAKRSYLADALAGRLGLSRGWASVTHVMVALWTAEVLHTLRLRTATFRALCPDSADVFAAWWAGSPPARGTTASVVLFDPCAAGRQRLFVGLDDALRVGPRHRGYAAVAERLGLR